MVEIRAEVYHFTAGLKSFFRATGLADNQIDFIASNARTTDEVTALLHQAQKSPEVFESCMGELRGTATERPVLKAAVDDFRRLGELGKE